MHAHKMRKTQRQRGTLLMTLVIATLTCSISQFDEVGAISTTTANEISTIDTTPDITETSTTLTASGINTYQYITADASTQHMIDATSAAQGATAISSDTATQSSIDITSTEQDATAISSDIATQSSIDITSTEQDATAISSDSATQSSIDITSTEQDATAISSDSATQSSIDITSVAQGTPATWSVAATKSVENTETTQQVTSTYSITSSKSIATSSLNPATYETTTVGTTPNESGTKDTLTTASPFASSNATSMMTSSIPGANDTLNVTTVVTSAKESTTGATTKIVPTTTQAAPLPPHQQPPNFDAAPDFKIPFTIEFYRNWTDDLAEPSSLRYRSLKSAVDLEIDVAFQGCPGYIALSASVVRFDNKRSSAAKQLVAASMMNSYEVLTLDDSNSSVVYADYQTYFETKQILENEEAILKHIAEQTMRRLQNATFDGSAIVLTSIDNMGDEVTSSTANLLSNPCRLIGTYICSICYNCSHPMPTPTGVSCVSKCSDDLKICTVTGNNSIGCTCKDKYLPVGHGCVNQTVIIGATVGVVGAVLLGLVIVVLVLCCRLKKKKIQYDTLDSTATLSETVRSRTVREVDESKSSTSREEEPMELSTFTRVTDTSPNQNGLVKGESNGAAPIAMERTSSVPRDYDEISSEPDQSPTEPKHDISSNRRNPVTIPSELRDDDLPEEITHSQAFMFFDPRLNSIDANTQFSIPRPTTTFQRSSTYTKPEENDYYI